MSNFKILAPPEVPAPSASLSPGALTERHVFTSGQVGTDQVSGKLASTLEGQIRAAIQNLESVLKAGGSGLDHIIKINCYLAEIGSFSEFDQIYSGLIPCPFPPRTTVGVSFAGNGDLLFEVDAIALVKGVTNA